MPQKNEERGDKGKLIGSGKDMTMASRCIMMLLFAADRADRHAPYNYPTYTVEGW
jgi:hypothetical protein